MKVNTTEAIIGYDHEPAIHQNGDKVTVQWVIQMALNTPIESMPWTPDTMLRCASLSKAAYEPDEQGYVDYSDADRQFILDRSAALCTAGRVTPMMHAYLVELFESQVSADA